MKVFATYLLLNLDKKTGLRSITQCAKKEVSDSLGLVDFAIGLVNSVFNLPDGQVKFFEEFKLQEHYEINSVHQNVLGAS